MEQSHHVYSKESPSLYLENRVTLHISNWQTNLIIIPNESKQLPKRFRDENNIYNGRNWTAHNLVSTRLPTQTHQINWILHTYDCTQTHCTHTHCPHIRPNTPSCYLHIRLVYFTHTNLSTLPTPTSAHYPHICTLLNITYTRQL